MREARKVVRAFAAILLLAPRAQPPKRPDSRIAAGRWLPGFHRCGAEPGDRQSHAITNKVHISEPVEPIPMA